MKKMNLAQRNNNPVNLRFAGQKEAVGESGGFAVFPHAAAGFRAAHNQIKKDQSRGLTVEQFVYKFAPPSENNTDKYLDFVIRELRISKTTPLIEVSCFALAGVLAAMEGYYNKEKMSGKEKP